MAIINDRCCLLTLSHGWQQSLNESSVMTWEIFRHRKKAICLSLRHQPSSSLPWFPLHSFPSTRGKAMPGSHRQQHGSWQTSSFPPQLHWYHVWAVTRSLLSHFSVTGYDYTGVRASETLGLTHSFLGQRAPIVNSKEHAECNGEPAPAQGKFVAPPKSALGPCSVLATANQPFCRAY